LLILVVESMPHKQPSSGHPAGVAALHFHPSALEVGSPPKNTAHKVQAKENNLKGDIVVAYNVSFRLLICLLVQYIVAILFAFIDVVWN